MASSSSKSEENKERSGDGFRLADLPDDLLRETLLKLPAQELVKSCMLVSKKWQNFVDSPAFWKEKCKLDLGYTDAMLLSDSGDFKKLYFQNPYSRNLIQNSRADEGFSHWPFLLNGGDEWLHCEPSDTHPVKKYAKVDGPVGHWQASWMACFKRQTIDLVALGCNPEVLDNLRPDVCISEWYGSTSDQDAVYKCEIDIMNEDKKLLNRVRYDDTKPAGDDWEEMTHVFSNYLPGLRYIKILHGGQDTLHSEGHYGPKITLTDVRLDFSHTSGPFVGEYKLPPQPGEQEQQSDSDDEGEADDEGGFGAVMAPIFVRRDTDNDQD